MKRICIITIVLALFLGLTQCKKEPIDPVDDGGKVEIMLNVVHNSAKVDVNTVTGEVSYETGDVIHVVSEGEYLGILVYRTIEGVSSFRGAIAPPTENKPLYFYFLGNVTPAFSADSTSCTVEISDQTERLPVIECAPSYENYTRSNRYYSAELLNKCALVKFDVNTWSDATTIIKGFNNMVSVDFSDASFAYRMVNEGAIELSEGSGEKWAILLPQDALDAGEEGSAYSSDGIFTGTCGAVPTVTENGFLKTGIAVNITNGGYMVPTEQEIGHVEDYVINGITGGVKLNFSMSGIYKVVMESVDGDDYVPGNFSFTCRCPYPIAGTAVAGVGGQISQMAIEESIITLSAPSGSYFEPGTDYYIVTFPCNVYDGYRLSIYVNDSVAPYFGVHQEIVAGEYITPSDLNEDELDFDVIGAPLVEEERPELDALTKELLRNYRLNPTEENRQALYNQMGVRYDKVVARKMAKLRELEREISNDNNAILVEMGGIVEEMVVNREERLEQRFLSQTDFRQDDNPDDEWLVLKGAYTLGENAYIGYAPVTNEQYAAYDPAFTYASGHEKYPVVNITYDEAMGYCNWLADNDTESHGYRLPTDYEWILAAGHMPKDVKMNTANEVGSLVPIDNAIYSRPKGNCGGIFFWGNSWEWTKDETYGGSGQYVVKGGAYDSSRDQCRTEYSGDTRDGSQGYPNVGFRVVRIDR